MKHQEFKNITAADIKGWNDKYAKVQEIVFPVHEDDLSGEKGVAKFYICKPRRNVYNAWLSAISAKDVGKASAILETNCVLGGDMKYLDEDSADSNDGVYYSLISAITELADKQRVSIKK